MRYEGEQEVTALDWQELENRNASDLTQMQGVISTDAIELPVIWKACLWKMNLFGHGKRLTVFREKTEIYNSYLTMTYRYGWFMIGPYVLYQVFMLKCAVEYINGSKYQQYGKNVRLLASMVSIIFLSFCIYGNPDQELTHPLWFMFFIGNGILFMERSIKKNGET